MCYLDTTLPIQACHGSRSVWIMLSDIQSELRMAVCGATCWTLQALCTPSNSGQPMIQYTNTGSVPINALLFSRTIPEEAEPFPGTCPTPQPAAPRNTEAHRTNHAAPGPPLTSSGRRCAWRRRRGRASRGWTRARWGRRSAACALPGQRAAPHRGPPRPETLRAKPRPPRPLPPPLQSTTPTPTVSPASPLRSPQAAPPSLPAPAPCLWTSNVPLPPAHRFPAASPHAPRTHCPSPPPSSPPGHREAGRSFAHSPPGAARAPPLALRLRSSGRNAASDWWARGPGLPLAERAGGEVWNPNSSGREVGVGFVRSWGSVRWAASFVRLRGGERRVAEPCVAACLGVRVWRGSGSGLYARGKRAGPAGRCSDIALCRFFLRSRVGRHGAGARLPGAVLWRRWCCGLPRSGIHSDGFWCWCTQGPPVRVLRHLPQSRGLPAGEAGAVLPRTEQCCVSWGLHSAHSTKWLCCTVSRGSSEESLL